jgi:site-specific DNA recombinase
MAEAKRALIYTRVSRDDTGEGKSNDRQRESCEALAKARGWEVVGCEDDISVSAYSGKDRPAWNRVLDAMRNRSIDYVIAWQLDRITRTVSELTALVQLARETGVAIVTSTGDLDLSNESGKFLATVLSAVAEMEVERKGARQKLANRQRAAEGKPWPSGWRPFGFEMDGTHVPHEADLIREAAERVLDGAPLRSIVRHWKSLGVTTPRSAKGAEGWTHNGVRSILLNARNAGLATYNGEIIGKGSWEPIISAETYTLLVAKLTDPARLTRGTSRGRAASNLLTGIATCAKCGGTVDAGSGHKGAPMYTCKGYHVSTPRAEADGIVRASVIAALQTTLPGTVVAARGKATPGALWQEAERLTSRLDSASSSYARGGITIEQLETASASLREQLADVEQRIAESTGGAASPLALRAEQIEDFENLDLDGQRAFLASLATIKLYPRGRGKRNVPIKHQVTVHLKGRRGRTIPALDERPKD